MDQVLVASELKKLLAITNKSTCQLFLEEIMFPRYQHVKNLESFPLFSIIKA